MYKLKVHCYLPCKYEKQNATNNHEFWFLVKTKMKENYKKFKFFVGLLLMYYQVCSNRRIDKKKTA